ncbi:hypothetical protein WMY93_020710 [Mugilogobius chulae]|uniref:Solute carrier family 46 member 2 n=1 Tax=Mugilogobius chulae TaxID=88201 RepID=A0AAW0N9T4_9GOBI
MTAASVRCFPLLQTGFLRLNSLSRRTLSLRCALLQDERLQACLRCLRACLRAVWPVIVLEELGSSLFDTALQMVVQDAPLTPRTRADTAPSHPARAAARAPRGPRLEAGPVIVPLVGYLVSRVMLLLVVSCDLPLQLMYGAGALFGLSGGYAAYWPGVMTLATLASTAENRSKTLMRVELLYGLAGLVGSLFSGHLFLFKTQSLGQGIVLLIVSTFLAAACLLDAVFLLQVTDVSQAEVEPESYGLIPPAAPTDTPIQRNIPNIALLFTAAVLYSSAVGGAVNVLGAFVLNKPLSWDATQVGYGNAAGCLIFITSYLGLVTLPHSDSVRSHSTATIRSLLSQQVPKSSCGMTLTWLQLFLKFAAAAYIPASTKIYQNTLDWFPGFVFTLSSACSVVAMIPVSIVGCRSQRHRQYETIQGD